MTNKKKSASPARKTIAVAKTVKPSPEKRKRLIEQRDQPTTKPPVKPAKRTRRPDLEAVTRMFSVFAAANPEPKGELEYCNPYTLLVAVVLSAQATDVGVNKATRALFKLADHPEKMVALGEDHVRDLIRTIGLFRNKAKNVIALSQRLIDDFGGEVPADRDVLETLPGVGRKTANVVMNMAFGQPTMAVDTHVFRVAHRVGLTKGKNPLAVEADLLRAIPEQFGMYAHHWLILHGRYLCKARTPECWRCPITELCVFKTKTREPELKR